MRQDGGDSERDDYGLPRVEVVVPDDARELERDLLTYRREVRQRQRAERRRRLTAPFVRHGVAVPIIAAALLVALVSGIMITVLGPRSAPQLSRSRITDSPSAGRGQVGGLLPEATVYVEAEARPLTDLAPGVIAVVPPACRCEATVADLARQTQAYRLKLTLVADRRDATWPSGQALADLGRLQGQAPKGIIGVADDRQSVVAAAYGPARPPRSATPQGSSTPPSGQAGPAPAAPAASAAPRASATPGRPTGLTAVLVRPDGTVNEVESNVLPGSQLKPGLERLLS